jgi:hypothetical protein
MIFETTAWHRSALELDNLSNPIVKSIVTFHDICSTYENTENTGNRDVLLEHNSVSSRTTVYQPVEGRDVAA